MAKDQNNFSVTGWNDSIIRSFSQPWWLYGLVDCLGYWRTNEPMPPLAFIQKSGFKTLWPYPYTALTVPDTCTVQPWPDVTKIGNWNTLITLVMNCSFLLVQRFLPSSPGLGSPLRSAFPTSPHVGSYWRFALSPRLSPQYTPQPSNWFHHKFAFRCT